MKCGVWRVQCEVWGVKSAVWSVECEESNENWEAWSVKCEVWSVKCEVWIGKSAVWSEKCGVWSVKCAVWSVKSAVRSVKGEVELQMWHVKQDTTPSQSARTHGLGWRTAHASSIDEKGLIYISKATSAPPRAGTTGIILWLLWFWLQHIAKLRSGWAWGEFGKSMAQAGGYLTYGKQLVPSPVWVWNHPVPEGELRRLPLHLWWDNVKIEVWEQVAWFSWNSNELYIYHYLLSMIMGEHMVKRQAWHKTRLDKLAKDGRTVFSHGFPYLSISMQGPCSHDTGLPSSGTTEVLLSRMKSARPGVLSPSHRERCFPWCDMVWLAESTSGMSWILWPKTFIDISRLSHRYQTGCFVMIGTLGWTPRVSKKKNEDFVSQKLVKLFPSCWQERKDVAPPCKPARNHNVQIDSLGFAHCRQVLPNYITNLLRDGYNAIPSQWVPVEL